MKEYKATLNPVKGKWYVCMTVPEEVRHLLNSQIKLSTGTSDKNEAQKRLPELAIKLKQKIADAKAILDADELRKEVKAIAAKLNRSAEFDIDNANTSQLIGILQQAEYIRNCRTLFIRADTICLTSNSICPPTGPL